MPLVDHKNHTATADLIEFDTVKTGRRLDVKSSGGIVEYPTKTRKKPMGQINEQRINPKRAAIERNRERRINAGQIADRIMGTLVLVKPRPAGKSEPQAITQQKRCLCCGAPAHEVKHD